MTDKKRERIAREIFKERNGSVFEWEQVTAFIQDSYLDVADIIINLGYTRQPELTDEEKRLRDEVEYWRAKDYRLGNSVAQAQLDQQTIKEG